MSKRLGIIQSRGLGDLVIALPIAKHYHDQGYEVFWPIDESFMSSMTASVPWIKWIPLEVDGNYYFYDTPLQRLKNFKCDEIICLYQALSSKPELALRPEFQITKFDQIKYSEAGVPFLNKWKLSECLVRNQDREQTLKDKVVNKEDKQYCVVHLEGSDHKAVFDRNCVPQDWQIIEIKPLTDSIFDWVGILEQASAIVCVDSVYANLIDQLGINNNVDCYFIPRSHIQLTPVMGGPWTYLEPDPETKKRITVFR